MRIGLLSDTHGFLDEAVFRYFESCDEIWHAGDIGNIELTDKLQKFKPVKAVYGNIDGHVIRSVWPENQIFTCEGVKVLMTHIAGYPGHFNQRARDLIRLHQPGLVIAGHSHILRVMHNPDKKFLFMNPGAAGNHGFHQVRTLLRFSIQDGRFHDAEAIELGRRTAVTSGDQHS